MTHGNNSHLICSVADLVRFNVIVGTSKVMLKGVNNAQKTKIVFPRRALPFG